MNEQLVKSVADRLKCDPKTLQAFMTVESGGLWKVNDLMVINYEAHIFRKESKKLGEPAEVPDRNIIRGDKANQVDERRNFEEALSKAPEAAYRALGMGIFQLQGTNYQHLGFLSAETMYQVLSDSEQKNYDSFALYIEKMTPGGQLLKAVRTNDWHRMAYYYNGRRYQDPKYVDSNGMNYAQRMEKAFEDLGGELPKPTPKKEPTPKKIKGKTEEDPGPEYPADHLKQPDISPNTSFWSLLVSLFKSILSKFKK